MTTDNTFYVVQLDGITFVILKLISIKLLLKVYVII